MRLVRLAPLLTLVLAGCGSVGAIGIPLGGGAATAPPADFNTVPTATQPVETTELPPVGGETTDPFAPTTDPFAQPLDPLAGPDEVGQPDQAAVLAANTNITVEFNDLIGGWSISLGGVTCTQFFLNGTPWESGFRGSTRNCASDTLTAISSWSLQGQEVVLYAAGVPVARLYPVSIVRDGTLVVSARFEGQMIAGGMPVAFFR